MAVGRMRGRDWSYGSLAACLGIAWCIPVLGLTRGEWAWWPATVEEYLVLSTFVVTSLFIAIWFRSWIRWARGPRSLLIGTALMLAGVFCTSLLITVGTWILEWNRAPFDSYTPPSLLDFVGYLYMGLLFAAYYFYVSIPMGVTSVVLLHWVDGHEAKRRVIPSPHIATASRPAQES